jgi:hypothetical protein
MTSISSVFGRIVTASQIEEAFILTLKQWFPTYLSEMERQLNMSVNSLPHPQNYTNRNSFDAEKAEEIPKVVVISPGLEGAPILVGSKTYRASWRVGVGVATAASEEEMANKMMKAYAGATRAIILQQLSRDTVPIAQVEWVLETYDDLPIPGQIQQYKAASLFFVVDVETVVSKGRGPDVPIIGSTAPEYTTANNVIIDLQKVKVIP